MKLPKTPKGIYTRIEQYKKALQKEKREWGIYDDSYGRRLLIGPLYLLANDTEGAIKYYKWYVKSFPDDSSEPFMSLCWTLSLYRAGKLEVAKIKLIHTMFSNLYILPHLFREDQPAYIIRAGSNWESKIHLVNLPDEYPGQWSEDEVNWAREMYYSNEITAIRERYIEIEISLQNETTDINRSGLLDELFALRRLKSI